MEPSRDVMDTRQAAAYLGVSTQTLELYRVTGGGPSYAKLGRLVRYRRAKLEEWLASLERNHTAEAGA